MKSLKKLVSMAPTRFPALSILSPTKSFSDPWVGHRKLNRMGLHPGRILLAGALTGLRRFGAGGRGDLLIEELWENGVAVVPDYFEESFFQNVSDEAHRMAARAEELRSVASVGDRGFGPRREFPGGFDRWDGNTLNRFLQIDEGAEECSIAAKALSRVATRAMGSPHTEERVWIYQTLQGGEDRNRDPQKMLHRDTFQPAVKFWYFLDAVTADDGAFEYVPRSHRMDVARLRWEYDMAMSSCERGVSHSSFRIKEQELASLGLDKPRSLPVRSNTLVIADVRGFHRRGQAKAGGRRLSLYSSCRPNPFNPLSMF